MLGFASLGYVTRWRQNPPHEMGMGGVFDLGPASSALPGPQGINILEMISLGHRANLKISGNVAICRAGFAGPAIKPSWCSFNSKLVSGPATN